MPQHPGKKQPPMRKGGGTGHKGGKKGTGHKGKKKKPAESAGSGRY